MGKEGKRRGKEGLLTVTVLGRGARSPWFHSVPFPPKHQVSLCGESLGRETSGPKGQGRACRERGGWGGREDVALGSRSSPEGRLGAPLTTPLPLLSVSSALRPNHLVTVRSGGAPPQYRYWGWMGGEGLLGKGCIASVALKPGGHPGELTRASDSSSSRQP